MRAIVFSKPTMSALAMTGTVFDSSQKNQKPQTGTRAGKPVTSLGKRWRLLFYRQYHLKPNFNFQQS